MKKKKQILNSFLSLVLFLASGLTAIPAGAGLFAGNFIDPTDGQLDMGKYLAEKKGVLPVPIIITEPSVGYGLGVAAVFFHDPLAGKTQLGKEFDPNPDVDGKLKAPSVSTDRKSTRLNSSHTDIPRMPSSA